MVKEELDKDYLNWEMEFKKKVLLYMNYVIGTMVVLEGIASYQVIYILLIYIYIYIEFGQNILLGTYSLFNLPSLGILWIKANSKIFFIRYWSLSECKCSSFHYLCHSINKE